MAILSNLRIQVLALHQITKETVEADATAVFTNELIPVNDAIEAELVRRLSESLGTGSNAVQMEVDPEEGESAYPQLIEILDSDDQEIIFEKSKELVSLLADYSRHRLILGGPVFVLKGLTSNQDKPFVAVIKAEYSSGFQIKGLNTVELIRNIFLTPNQKLFKIGFITLSNPSLELPDRLLQDNLISIVFDVNTGHRNNANLATYFYKKFLGLKFRETDEVFTKDFFVRSKNFFIKKIDDPSLRFEHINRLYTYLTSSRRVQININEFIRDNVDENYQTAFRAEIGRTSLPRLGFVKNTSYINNDLMKRVLVFDDNKIRIPYQLLSQSEVTIDKGKDQTVITIIGTPTEQ